MSTKPLSEFAVVVSSLDNLAVVKFPVSAGEQLDLGDRILTINGNVNPGHRFATKDIPAGEFVRQYGQPIGTSLGIKAGDAISHANMTDEVPVVRDLPEDLDTSPGTFRTFFNPDFQWFSSGRRSGRNPELYSDRSDFDVCIARSTPDFHCRRIHALE